MNARLEQLERFAEAFRSVLGDDNPLDAARKSGKNPEYIREIMKAVRIPSTKWIKAFCEAYGVEADSLIALADRMATPEVSKDSIEAIEYALRQTTDLSEDGKRQVVDFARKVKEEHAGYGKPEENRHG